MRDGEDRGPELEAGGDGERGPVQLFGVGDHPVDLGHGFEPGRVELGGAAGDEDARVGPATAGAADRLAGLANRFACTGSPIPAETAYAKQLKIGMAMPRLNAPSPVSTEASGARWPPCVGPRRSP